MEKLKHQVVIPIPTEHQDEVGEEKLIFDIFFVGDDRKNAVDYELYAVELEGTDEKVEIRIVKEAMDFSREIEEEGGGPIEEFIFRLWWQHLVKEVEEMSTRDFLEDISD
jgi:hypothetical protein